MDHGGASSLAIETAATLLYDYPNVEDPTCETMEMLKVSEVMKWVMGLVFSGTIVMAGCAVDVFSVNFRPNLLGCLDSFFFLC